MAHLAANRGAVGDIAPMAARVPRPGGQHILVDGGLSDIPVRDIPQP